MNDFDWLAILCESIIALREGVVGEERTEAIDRGKIAIAMLGVTFPEFRMADVA